MSASHLSATPPERTLGRAGFILGIALGAFFDGILLHQVLQWHHLLSLVPGEALRDIRTQILWDGLFHVAVYAVAAVGLAMLWRGRAGFSGSGSDRRLLADTVLGFSIWQFLDVVLFHWILGIHRIRVDVPDPLVWDIGWMVVFGVPTLLLGLWLRRSGTNPPDASSGGRRPVAAAMLSVAVLVAGPVAALPPPGLTTTMVLFRPGTGPADAFAAVAAVDGRVLWTDPSGELMAVDVKESGAGWRLYAHGALLVGNSALVAGCLTWSRATPG